MVLKTLFPAVLLVWAAFGAVRGRAQVLDGFAWVDQKTDTATMASVAHILRDVDYTSILQVGYLAPSAVPDSTDGGETREAGPPPVASALLPHDSHIFAVVAKLPTPTALPSEAVVSVYDLSLKYETSRLLLTGANLHFSGWLRFTREDQPELVATYQDCAGPCQKTTFFTAIHLDRKTGEWQARWPRSISGAPLFSEGQEANGSQQVYALLVDDTGKAVLGTWQHYPGKSSDRASDYVFSYHLTQWTFEDVTEPLEGAAARAMEARLCRAADEALGIAGGQSSSICKGGTQRGKAANPAGHR